MGGFTVKDILYQMFIRKVDVSNVRFIYAGGERYLRVIQMYHPNGAPFSLMVRFKMTMVRSGRTTNIIETPLTALLHGTKVLSVGWTMNKGIVIVTGNEVEYLRSRRGDAERQT